MRSLISLTSLTAVALSLMIAPAAAQGPRIKTLVTSADRVLEGLEFLVDNLAEEHTQWEENIYPNVDIFLIGVDTQQPIRFDVIFGGGGESGFRYQPCIPIAVRDHKRQRDALKRFLRDNLEPIGIDWKQKNRRGTEYELSGDVYEGLMRIVENKAGDSVYACIAAKGFEETDIPKDMPHPSESHKDLIVKGYDLAAEFLNDADETAERDKGFMTFQENMLATIKKRPEETKDQFALRQTTAQHQFEVLHRAYVEAERATVGWTTDIGQQEGRGELHFSAFPETPLAAYLQMLAAEPSHFAVLDVPEDPVLSLRVNLPFDELRQSQQRTWYELVRPVILDKLDTLEDRTDDEKAALKEITNKVIDMLVAGIDIARADVFAEITANPSGHHTLLAGIRAKDGKAADAIIELIPAAHEGWSVEMNVDAAAQLAVHKIDVSQDAEESLVKFFGPSGAIYVATGVETVWVAAGDGAVDTLKEAIEAAAGAEPPAETDPTFFSLNLHALPLITLADEYTKETGFSLSETLDLKSSLSPSPAEGTEDEPVVTQGGLKPIDPEELRELVIKALQNIDDRMTAELVRVDDHVEGQSQVSKGLLRAVGKLIAKIAADNL